MQRNIFETILGAVVLLVAAGFLFFFYRTTDIKPATGYEITAEFDNVDGLQGGSAVRISGVKVGQVLGFEMNPANYRAVVHMNIDASVKVPVDSSAVISSAGLLDAKFLTLQPGGDEQMLKSGGKIEYTQSSVSLEKMLGQFIFSVSKNSKKDDDDAAPAKDDAPDADAPKEAPAKDKAPGAEPAPAPAGGSEDHP
ncbi:MAG: outer membrane lipid asymmetry maintenance protein MlaD [Micavibrio sp.]|nr:outer membrane lipid asymmetry maintenance protein MlaD [Micavibrio sp.]